MDLIKRFFGYNAASHPTTTVTEDAIKVTEKGISELKDSLSLSIKLIADLRLMSEQARQQLSDSISEAELCDKKAFAAFELLQIGNDTSTNELIQEALMQKEVCMEQVYQAIRDKEKFDAAVSQMDQNVFKIRNAINDWENDLAGLRKRAIEIADRTEPDLTIARQELQDAMLVMHRMKEKAVLEKALADLEQIVNIGKSQVIEHIRLNANPDLSRFHVNRALEALQYKMLMNKRIKESNDELTVV